METKLYAQLDENNICHTVSEYVTDIEATLENLGKQRVWVETYTDENGVIILEHWEWKDIPKPITPNEPTNAEVAQMLSELYADLLIAGVIS